MPILIRKKCAQRYYRVYIEYELAVEKPRKPRARPSGYYVVMARSLIVAAVLAVGRFDRELGRRKAIVTNIRTYPLYPAIRTDSQD